MLQTIAFLLSCVVMGTSVKFLIDFNHRERTCYACKVDEVRSNGPLEITINLDYFTCQPKNNKNLKIHDEKKGVMF